MTTPKAVYRNDGTVALTFPFRRELVDALKQAIPASAREWEPTSKTWFVALGYDDIALYVIRSFFPDVVVTTEAAERRSQVTVVYRGNENDPDRVLLCVTRDAPPEVIHAAYRAWSKLAHPDRGGDPELMRKINLAYERLTSAARSGVAS